MVGRMEGNGLNGRMFPSMGGMLGLEMTLHPPQTQATPQNPHQNPQNSLQNPQNPQNHLQKHHLQVLNFTPQNHPNTTSYTAPPQNPPPRNKSQMTHLTNSDDEEPHNESFDVGKRKSTNNVSNTSPWHRMKWTDNMVRLLIVAVYYMEDDQAGSELLGPDKKKPGCSSSNATGSAQKKGKWKSVSKAMMEKGFIVSPQQCEDKFNDLNKRYKRVNDILGKGTACKVVENQALLETMDISPKLKEEARKLLNSKHLFFREMCAYHNSCGHGNAKPTTTETASPVSGEISHQQRNQQQSCLHSSNSTQMMMQPLSMVAVNSKPYNHEEDDDDDEDDDVEDDSEDQDEFNDDDDDQDEGPERKKARKSGVISSSTSWATQKLHEEIMGALGDATKNPREKQQWVMTQLVRLEEKGVKFQYDRLELEKQRVKWVKFSNRKEREMEKMKIDNERNRLENQRMVLMLKQKEIELLFPQQITTNSSNP